MADLTKQDYESWLQDNENLIGTDSYDDVVNEYEQLFLKKSATQFAKNVPTDIGNIVLGGIDMVTSPIDTSAGIADIATTGAVNLLPKPLVDALFAYEKDPTSLQYKANQYFKDSDYLNFLYTQPREQYEKIGTKIGQDIKESLTPEAMAERFYEKPVSSLLDYTGLGRLFNVGLKSQKLQKALDVVDPSQYASKGIGMLDKRFKATEAFKAAQNAVRDKVNQTGQKLGFVTTPSKSTGSTLLSRLPEKITGGKTLKLAQEKNQKNANKLIREWADVPADTPLEDILQTVKNRSGKVYDDIAKVPAVTKKVPTQKQINTGVLDEKENPIYRTVTGSRTQTIHRSGKDILNDIQKQRTKVKNSFKNAGNEKSNVTYDDAYAEYNKLDDLENELEKLMEASGDDFADLASKLKDARADYAKGFMINNSLKGGDINLSALIKNSQDKMVTGKGKDIIEFAKYNPEVIRSPKVGDNKLEEWAMGALFIANPAAAASIAGARSIIPSLLLSKPVQKAISLPDYAPYGSGIANAFSQPSVLYGAAEVPSLLKSSEIEDLPYLR